MSSTQPSCELRTSGVNFRGIKDAKSGPVRLGDVLPDVLRTIENRMGQNKEHHEATNTGI